jgi:hypothetical protein
MQGKWMHCFEENLPADVTEDQLIKNNREITLDQVQEWVEENDGIAGRFRFFKAFGKNSIFYHTIAKPLLSMRAVGSIDVERRIKPVKHSILTRDRNRLSDEKGVVLYRASENLNHLMRAKRILGMRINEPLLPRQED